MLRIDPERGILFRNFLDHWVWKNSPSNTEKKNKNGAVAIENKREILFSIALFHCKS